jgi:hypothetical protein
MAGFVLTARKTGGIVCVIAGIDGKYWNGSLAKP